MNKNRVSGRKKYIWFEYRVFYKIQIVDFSEKTSVERKFLDDGRISEISGIGSSKNVKWRYSCGYRSRSTAGSGLAFQSRRQSQSSTAEKSRCKTRRTEGEMRACALRWRFMGFENSPSPSNPFIRRRQDFENFWLISAIIFRIGSLVSSGIFSREAMVLENL